MQLTWPCLWCRRLFLPPSLALVLSSLPFCLPRLVRVVGLGFWFLLCDLQQFSSVFDYENDLVVVVVVVAVVLACVFDFFLWLANPRHTLR